MTYNRADLRIMLGTLVLGFLVMVILTIATGCYSVQRDKGEFYLEWGTKVAFGQTTSTTHSESRVEIGVAGVTTPSETAKKEEPDEVVGP